MFHTNHVYVHLMQEFAKSGLVPAELHGHSKQECLNSVRLMTTLHNHPDWKGTDELLSE
jgi:hypothetical protein